MTGFIEGYITLDDYPVLSQLSPSPSITSLSLSSTLSSFLLALFFDWLGLTHPEESASEFSFLAVKVDWAEMLPEGFQNSFIVIVEWNGCIQKTQMQFKSNALQTNGRRRVIIDEALFFPIRSALLIKGGDWQRESIEIRVFDCPEDNQFCRSFLGGHEIGMIVASFTLSRAFF